MVTKEQVIIASKSKARRGRKARFDADVVNSIRERFVNDPTATVQALAEEHGVSYATMLKVIYGKGSYSF
jgi:hypothetical protein